MSGKLEIIDDDESVRDSLTMLLGFHGYTLCTHDSAEAFLASGCTGADCLLVDHHMPGMTGLALLEHLRAAGNNTPALLITGRVDRTISDRARQLGIPVLMKPVEEGHLVQQIEMMRSSLNRPGS